MVPCGRVRQVTDPLLFTLDGQLESRETHVFVVVHVQLPGCRRVDGVGDGGHRLRVVVENDLELLGAARLVEQLDGEVATLLRQLLILALSTYRFRNDTEQL